MLDKIAVTVNEVLRRSTGFSLRRNPVSFDDLRLDLISENSVDLVLDGGANRGQWALRLQRGFRKRGQPCPQILSFEPSLEAYRDLLRNTQLCSGSAWTAKQVALGAESGTGMLHVAANEGQSSSLRLPQAHLIEYASVSFNDTEAVSVERLDSVGEIRPFETLFLKLDVQGFEKDALLGATGILSKVAVIEVETSFREMYSGQWSHLQILQWLEENNFQVQRYSDAGLTAEGSMLYIDVLATKKV